MRPLKFRAWDTLAKKYTYPDKGYQGHYCLSLNGEFHNLQNGSGGKEYVVQQFTGLQDCKGQDIYEGDIVRAKSIDPCCPYKTFTAEVIFEGGWRYKISQDDIRGVWSGVEEEVVGNVFENLKP